MAKPGDRVEIKTKEHSYEGVLMPRPKIFPGNAVILKLDSGYNIGILKGKIKKITVISKAREPKSAKISAKADKALPKVTILSTGGTISSKVDYLTGGVKPAIEAEDFITNVPEVLTKANITAKPVMQIFSEDITTKDWQKLAKAVYAEIKKGADGIVVTHGTDTMHFSAAAISFMVQNSPIPIIFVGSQRSVDRGSSDAFPNLFTAVAAAAKWNGAESVICMHSLSDDTTNVLMRGVKTRKMHTERRDAFRPINNLPLARIDYHGNMAEVSEYKIRSNSKPVLNTKMDEKVAIIYTYPGIDPAIVKHYLKKGYHGLVIAGTGLGHTPTTGKNSFLPVLKECFRKKVPVIMSSQCFYGRTNPYVYEAARKLMLQGKLIYAEDMLPEVAYVKLMHVLGQTRNYEKVKELMLTNMVGEINPIISAKMFLC
jgi:glutamyl-tRNA(Gln) amidotransferase subunit D